ncbi:MAG: DUF3127 domain-containing protein [Melioribacteraceae bacterium]
MIQKITGKIRTIFDTQNIGDNFSKRKFAVDYIANPDAKWNKPCPIQFYVFNRKKDKINLCNELNTFSPADEVEVVFSLRGREFNGKYFNVLECISIKALQLCKEINK